MSKPTFASVTEVPCSCRTLERAADDPKNPIVFDAETAEYQFVFDSEMLVIYHCPFCGGATPKSKRHSLFARIPIEEESRIAELMDGIDTIDDAVQKLGKPDFEGTLITRYLDKGNQAPIIEHHREICYESLSDSAEIRITERSNGKISWQLQGKYLGGETGNQVEDRDG